MLGLGRFGAHWSVFVLGSLAWLVPAAAMAGGGFGDTGSAPRCEGTTELMAVIYNDHAPQRSLAMLAGEGGGGARIARVGSRIDGRPIVAILPQAVWLGPPEKPCWIPLGHEGTQKVEPPPNAPPPERKKDPKFKMKNPNYKMKR